MKVAEVFALLGFEVDDKGAEEFDKKIESIAKNMRNMALAASAAIFAIDRFTESATRASIAIGNFALQTGLSAEKLQQWQYAAQMSNMAMDADQTATSIKNLQQALLEIRMGGGNPEAFRWLGVNPMNKDAFKVIEELRGSVKKLDPAFASMYLKQIGLNENWLNVLKLTDEEFANLMEKAPVRSNAYIKAMEAAGKMSREFRIQFKLMLENVVEKGLPLLKKFYEGLAQGISMVTNISTAALKIGTQLAEVWKGLPEWMKSVAAVVGLLRFPLAALLLILDDIAMYINGGDSVFGRVVAALQGTFQSMGDWIKKYIVDPLTDVLNAIKDARNIFDRKNNAANQADLKNLVNKELGRPGQVGDVPFDPNWKPGDELSNTPLTGEHAEQLVGDQWVPMSPASDGSKAGDIRSLFDSPSYGQNIPKEGTFRTGGLIQNNTINVTGSGDPQATADAITNNLQRQLNNTTSSMNNTVNY